MSVDLENAHACPAADGKWYSQIAPEEEIMQIAIIGMACRLPGYISNLESFWNLCLEARNTWSKVPKDRFSQETFYHPNPDKTNCVSRRPLAFQQRPNSSYSGIPKAVTSFLKIFHASTPISSVSQPRRPIR